MGQFSDDHEWWWDGTTWLPTAQIVLPQLPLTEFERSGKLAAARASQATARLEFWTGILLPPTPAGLMPDVRRVVGDYRIWTIEQLSLATAFLLGPEEPMLAGEMSRYLLGDSWTRNLAVAVTAARVIVFRIDNLDGQPRWVAMAAGANAVAMKRRTVFFGWLYQSLEIKGPNGLWSILGLPGEDFDPKAVLNAWRQAAAGAVQTR